MLCTCMYGVDTYIIRYMYIFVSNPNINYTFSLWFVKIPLYPLMDQYTLYVLGLCNPESCLCPIP